MTQKQTGRYKLMQFFEVMLYPATELTKLNRAANSVIHCAFASCSPSLVPKTHRITSQQSQQPAHLLIGKILSTGVFELLRDHTLVCKDGAGTSGAGTSSCFQGTA